MLRTVQLRLVLPCNPALHKLTKEMNIRTRDAHVNQGHCMIRIEHKQAFERDGFAIVEESLQ